MNQEEAIHNEHCYKTQLMELQHQESMFNEFINRIYSVVNKLGCKITKDGNSQCCLYGEDLHDGIAGFGDTPHESVLNFAKEFGIN